MSDGVDPPHARSSRPVHCLIGPTASGKSRLAMAYAQAIRETPLQPEVEIISLDSAQIYRGLDLGTAKPSAAERSAVAHHLIDLLEPEDHYSVAQCHQDVWTKVGEIRARGHEPLIVGGTMLYFKALLAGLDQLPQTPPAIRDAVAAEALAEGWPALHAQLMQVDPSTAQRLAPHDAQRISRALEVWRHTGESLSDWILKSQDAPALRLQALPMRTVALLPQDRTWLHRRIEQRFLDMVDQGLLEEVAGLMQRPHLTGEHPSMRSVGYRQAWLHLSGDLSREAFIRKGIEATRQLAKRQITWLRSFQAAGSVTAWPAETADLPQMMRVWSSPD